MSLEASITKLDASVQALIALMSENTAPKAVKAEPIKKVEPTPVVEAAPVEIGVDEVIAEMKVIPDRTVLLSLLEKFDAKTESGIAPERRAAFIESIHLELKGAA
jgi:hypothetical protein